MRRALTRARCSIEDNYRRCLQQAWLILAMLVAVCALAAYHAQNFSFDASAETLIQQDDPELDYYESFNKRFDQAPRLFMTYTPKSGDLFGEKHLQRIGDLQQRLLDIADVRDVTSILDVPLLESPPVPLSSMASDFNTLRQPDADPQMAREELTGSPLFSELLVSADGQTTALAIELKSAPAADKQRRSEVIQAVREVRDTMSEHATLYLGGVPMVAADMIEFVREDAGSFGIGVLVLVCISLYAFFRRLRWVLIPLGTTAVTLLLTMGLLGYLDQPVTVISSNFVPLIAIVTISFTIHLISRYRELRYEGHSDSHLVLVSETMISKFAPCLYTALTTMVAFSSLLTSDIVPVVDFGWIMCVGIVLSLLVTYSFFASVLMLLPKGPAASTLGKSRGFTVWMQSLALHRQRWLLAAAVVSILASAIGIARLELGSRFTEYFREGTEIRDGMTFIDRKLGGTIPLEVVVEFTPFTGAAEAATSEEEDIFAMEGAEESYPERYWFTPDRLATVGQLHDYLDQRREVGKVLSLASLEAIARRFNDGEPLGYVELTGVLGMVPTEVRRTLIEPYAAPRSGEMRISARLHETGPRYSIEALLADIRNFATQEMGLEAEQIRITGMAVLFNDVLGELLISQRSTLVFVVFATLIMFALLLASPTMAVIGVLPNVLAAAAILGLMGLMSIPLDMMTITIAAIVIGIGVDDAIHYLHRFKEEYAERGNAAEAIKACHSSIGHALYYTSITVMIGFSVLGFSNFIPTVYFGLLAALAMVLALLANLTLLPALLAKLYD